MKIWIETTMDIVDLRLALQLLKEKKNRRACIMSAFNRGKMLCLCVSCSRGIPQTIKDSYTCEVNDFCRVLE